MRENSDCEVAALATACQVSYDQAKAALNWRKLPMGAENPVFGNSLNLHRALIKLGFWKRNVTLTELLAGKCKAGETVVLVKLSPLQQHWVVWAGRKGEMHAFFWGSEETPKWIRADRLIEYFTEDGPVNEAFEVYKANAFRVIIERVKSFFGRGI